MAPLFMEIYGAFTAPNPESMATTVTPIMPTRETALNVSIKINCKRYKSERWNLLNGKNSMFWAENRKVFANFPESIYENQPKYCSKQCYPIGWD